jgi:hypothetical protein
MANIFVNIEKGIEVAAEDVLHFIAGADKALALTPAVVAGLGTILGAVSTAVTASESAAQGSGLNIALDQAAWTDIKAIWPDIVAFAKSIGIKL